MDIVKLWRMADADLKDAAHKLAGGEASPDDMELATVIVNIAIDANYGNKEDAILYLNRIKETHPALSRLMARIGVPIVESKASNKQ